jgi:hypothetical protein
MGVKTGFRKAMEAAKAQAVLFVQYIGTAAGTNVRERKVQQRFFKTGKQAH